MNKFNVGLFIRSDNDLVGVINILLNSFNLRYIIVSDDCNSDIFKPICNTHSILLFYHSDFIEKVNNKKISELDFIFSFLYQKKIETELLVFPKNGSINFHPAPLPRYRGVGNYSSCIMEGLENWGVSAHYMDDELDNGKIIKVLAFPIAHKLETYKSLEEKSKKHLILLLKEVIEYLTLNKKIENSQNLFKQEIFLLTKKQIKKNKEVLINDSHEIINKKIRAYWRPPFNGATIKINDKLYTILNSEILNEL